MYISRERALFIKPISGTVKSLAVYDKNTGQQLRYVKNFSKPLLIRESFYREHKLVWIDNKGLRNEYEFPPFKTVLIEMHSRALGDQIAWIPIIDLFQKKHDCKVIVRCYFPELISPFYPNIEFKRQYFDGEEIPKGLDSTIECDAAYVVGYTPFGMMFGDNKVSPVDVRPIALQGIACVQLGFPIQEIQPKFYSNIKEPIVKGKYVCITTCGTIEMKKWHNPNGFKDVVAYLLAKGYQVVDLGNESSNIDGVTSMNGLMEWNKLMNILQHSELMVSTTNGLQWLAYAVGTKVVSVNGNTMPETLFKHSQVINYDVCHGCFNDVRHVFNASDKNYCPRKKNFECSREISSEMVINELKKILC